MTNSELLLAMSNMLEPIRDDIREIKGDILELKNDVAELKKEMKQVKTDIVELYENVSELSRKVTRLEQYAKNINHRQENDIIPRLQNIEQCYLSTYERYKLSVDDHEVMKQDISVLKLVVTEHSEKLQRIS